VAVITPCPPEPENTIRHLSMFMIPLSFRP
jgi:hypothetical protein